MLYAIVDIETTGGHAAANGITEIAIAIHDGKQVIQFYETLLNPLKPIPYFIQNLTGIDDNMVAAAPLFSEKAKEIYTLLEGKIFIAHNVNFDYSFVKHHLEKAGYNWSAKKLCSVRMARKILPGMKSYSLGKLCHQLKIAHSNRHRAGGDALATAALFSLLVAKDINGEIPKMLKGKNTEQYLPPHLPAAQILALPATPGVYYFHNQAGKIIYIGKAKNIAKRVRTHFSNNKTNKQKQDFLKEINKVTYTECATELMAHILESVEIRKLWPSYNRSQRGYLPKYGLYAYEDRDGFLRLAVEKNKMIHKPVFSFNTIHEGHQRLRSLIKQFELCPRLCNLSSMADCTTLIAHDECIAHCRKGIETYNHKVVEALTWMQKHLPSFAFIDKGIAEDTKSCILIRKGNIYGMGYIDKNISVEDPEKLASHLEPLQDNDFIRNLVYKHARDYPEKCYNYA